MDSAVSLSVTPVQAMLALAFYIWLIVFPIILMMKINRLEKLVEDYLISRDGTASEDNKDV